MPDGKSIERPCSLFPLDRYIFDDRHRRTTAKIFYQAFDQSARPFYHHLNVAVPTVADISAQTKLRGGAVRKVPVSDSLYPAGDIQMSLDIRIHKRFYARTG